MRPPKMDFIGAMIFSMLVVGTQILLLAQGKTLASRPLLTVVSVPFIGCEFVGPSGPREKSHTTSASVPIDPKAARGLAYYSAEEGLGSGVLGPRGWYCYGVYGSGGTALLVSPGPINPAAAFARGGGFSGPAIEINHRSGDTSGRFEVAEIIARVFPAYKAFVTRVTEMFESERYTFGPYPGDTLTYKSQTVLEYKTPAETDGLGTHSTLQKNRSPIYGAAILAGPTPDLVLCRCDFLPI
jgi:hypothetical protein